MSQSITALKNYQLLIFDWEGTLAQAGRGLFSDVLVGLTTLRTHYRLAIATNCPRQVLTRYLLNNQLIDYFVTTRCADETRLKPDPCMLQEMLNELAISAAQALMIGDSEADLAMARCIKMDSVAMRFQGRSNQAPKVYCNSVQELIIWLT